MRWKNMKWAGFQQHLGSFQLFSFSFWGEFKQTGTFHILLWLLFFNENRKDNLSAWTLSTWSQFGCLSYHDGSVLYVKATHTDLRVSSVFPFQLFTKDNASSLWLDNEVRAYCAPSGGSGGRKFLLNWACVGKVNNTFKFTSAHMLTLRPASDVSYQLLCCH